MPTVAADLRSREKRAPYCTRTGGLEEEEKGDSGEKGCQNLRGPL